MQDFNHFKTIPIQSHSDFLPALVHPCLQVVATVLGVVLHTDARLTLLRDVRTYMEEGW